MKLLENWKIPFGNSYGRIAHSEFLGSLIRYGVDLAGTEILVDEPHQAGQPILPEGSDVTACLSADQVRILRE